MTTPKDRIASEIDAILGAPGDLDTQAHNRAALDAIDAADLAAETNGHADGDDICAVMADALADCPPGDGSAHVIHIGKVSNDPSPPVVMTGLKYHVEMPLSHYGQCLPAQSLAEHVMGTHKLLVFGGQIFEWFGSHWVPIKEEVLNSYIAGVDGKEFSTTRRINEVRFVIANHPSTVHRKITWNRLGKYEVPFNNGVYNLETDTIRPHKPEDYLDKCLPHDYDPKADPECPLWLSLFDDWFSDEPDRAGRITAIRQYFGYCLMGQHADFKTALFLYGKSNSGKSVITHVLKALVGVDNTCTINVDAFNDPRKLAPIVGKMVNIVPEIDQEAVLASGGFKTLVSTTEPVLIDPKNVWPYLYIPTCKHVLLGNNLPRITDTSMGVYNRLLIIGFNKVYAKHEQDRRLPVKLVSEINGIMRWALDGARELLALGGEFTAPSSSTDLVEAYQRSQNPVGEFIADYCIKAEGEFVPAPEFQKRFYEWLGSETSRWGRTRISRYMVQSQYKKQRRRVDGKLEYVYLGLRFLDSRDLADGESASAEAPF